MTDNHLPIHLQKNSLRLAHAKGIQLAARGRSDLHESGPMEQQKRAEVFFRRHPGWFIEFATGYY
ncbi:MAG: hypothetical protein KKH74_01385 [Gammaproteobacteria bacterium]|nr:hypothetical protein [Gammaproteobacteria bacterium]MBU1731914.1 hypothetical protein [Gammaproteobacteria bacterium]MBU1891269.1 hypothetical protein [Gammaproteobacteria bacterium]